MAEEEKRTSTDKTITLGMLIMMIFTTIYGFGNITVAYMQMGYASIIWYVLAAIFFFLPVGFMIAEYGAAYSDAKGGIYTWLEGSLGQKNAFIGTFIWVSSWTVWLVSSASKLPVPMTVLIYGHDTTQTWHWLGLGSTQILGIIGMVWIIIVTFFAAKGIDGISKISSFGGTILILLNIVFIACSVYLLFAQGFKTAEPIHGWKTFLVSPNPEFQSLIGTFSFAVYAIFAYAGLESLGGVTDSMKNPKKDFPLGITISAVLIAILYCVSIFLWGVSSNWHSVFANGHANLANVSYVLMDNLGVKFGLHIGLSHYNAVILGQWYARFYAFDNLVTFVGAFFVLIYSPIKSLILGTPSEIWPKGLDKLNEHGMPERAMWVQAIIVDLIIFGVSFGGPSAQKFFEILTLMMNVSSAVPYLYLVGAYPRFNTNDKIEKPYVFFKDKKKMYAVSIITWLVVAFAIFFTCLDPILTHDWYDAFWTISGPIIFGAIGWLIYHGYEVRQRKAENS